MVEKISKWAFVILNKIRIILIFLVYFFMGTTVFANEKQCVILLHGLARSPYSMSVIEKNLQSHHYIVFNEDYPSTKISIEQIAKIYIHPMISECLKCHCTQIDFVTHSLGGIILEAYLQHNTIPHLNYIVMLGPPNHGSPLADILHDNLIFKIFTGPAGQELRTGNQGFPQTLHVLQNNKIGIIAGNFSLPFGKYIFQEANDGKVSVSSTQIKNMKDFIVLPVSHTFMVSNKIVNLEILNFLQTGKFIH